MDIKLIEYPNNVIANDKSVYEVGKSCDEIISIMKNGEMSLIKWFKIVKDDKVIEEIPFT